GLSRLPVVARQTEVTKQQHCVGRRDPLGRVKPAVRRQPTGPCARRVLPGKQTGAPTLARYFPSLSLDRTLPRPGQILQGLPANGWVPVEEPLDHLISS